MQAWACTGQAQLRQADRPPELPAAELPVLLSPMPPHLPFAKGLPLPPGILPFQIVLGGGVAAVALPRPPVEMPLGRPLFSEELPWAAPKPWPPPSAVPSATGGVGGGVLSVGAVGAGVAATAEGRDVAESPNPPKPAGLPGRLRPVPGCVSALTAAGVTDGVGGGVAAAWPSSAPFSPVPASAELQAWRSQIEPRQAQHAVLFNEPS